MYQQIYATPDLTDVHIIFADVVYQDGYSEEVNTANFEHRAFFDRDYTPAETRAPWRNLVSMIVSIIR